MNVKKNKTIIDLLNTVNGSFVIYTIIITMLFTIGESEYALPSAFLLVIPILSYYLEQRAKHIFTFLLCHIITGMIFVSLPKQLIVKIIYAIFTIVVMIYHLYRRVKRESYLQNTMSFTYFAVLIVLQFYANWKAYSQLSRMIQIITLVCAIIYFTRVYLFNFTDFFTNDVINTNINLQRIKRINHGLVICFISINTVIMIGALSVPTNKILYALKSIMIFILRILFFWVKPSDNTTKLGTVEESAPNTELFMPIEPTETSPVWLFIQDLLFKLSVVVTILAFVALIIYGLYQLYKHFHTVKADETDQKEFISPFYKENKVKRMKKNNKARLPHIFPNNNDKIRRYFYHIIINKYKDKVPDNLTAEELLNLPVQKTGLLISEETEKFDPMILELYHKARYSDEMCSKEEVNMVKGIVRGKK